MKIPPDILKNYYSFLLQELITKILKKTGLSLFFNKNKKPGVTRV